MKEKGLEPNPEAEDYELIKRASLDLTGLPPSPEILERYQGFEGENTYEDLLNNLLSEQSFGEKLAILWLDISRYSDSYAIKMTISEPNGRIGIGSFMPSIIIYPTINSSLGNWPGIYFPIRPRKPFWPQLSTEITNTPKREA